MKKLLLWTAAVIALVAITYAVVTLTTILPAKEVAFVTFLLVLGLLVFGMSSHGNIVFPALVGVFATFASYLKLLDNGGTVNSPVPPEFVFALAIGLVAFWAAQDLRLRYFSVLLMFAVQSCAIYFLLVH